MSFVRTGRVGFNDHAGFQRAARHAVVAGALLGLAVHVAGLVFARVGGLGGPISLAAIVLAAGLAAGERDRLRHLLMLTVLGAAAAIGPMLTHGSAALWAFALPAGLMLAWSRPMPRFLVITVAGMVAALGARFVVLRMAAAPELAGLPGWLLAAVAGAAGAFVAVMGSVARHVTLEGDRVAEAHAQLGKLQGEMAELILRAHTLWTRVDQTLPATDPVRRSIEDAVVRLYEVARRWHEVETDGGRPTASGLVDRMAALDDKLAATRDEVARQQYVQAKAALAEQLRFVEGIATSRERVLARMHNYLAAMERLRLALLNHRSADASAKSSEVAPILADLAELGQEIDLGSQAMGEVERAMGEEPGDVVRAQA